MGSYRIEKLCSDLGVGPREIYEFLFEMRRERAAQKLKEHFYRCTVDEMTKYMNAIENEYPELLTPTPLLVEEPVKEENEELA